MMSGAKFSYELNLKNRNERLLQSGDSSLKVVLAVDDMPLVLNNIAAILGSRYTVLLAKDGRTALSILAKQHVDLVLLDQGMSGMPGNEVLGAIRSVSSLKNLPVLFLSATITEEFINLVAPLRPAGYIVKPFNPNNLLKTIERILYSGA
jgi:DNA-binding response OmpR family regulator